MMAKHKFKKAKKAGKASMAVTLAPAPIWDQGATGPANQDGLIDQERGHIDMDTGKVINPNRVFGKRRMPIVERMHRQGKLTETHVAAAQRLYAAWAGYPTRDPIAAIGDRVDGGGCDDPNGSRVDQKREFFILKERIPPRCWPVVEHVVINDLAIRLMLGCSHAEAFAMRLGQLTEGLEAVA